MINIKFGTDRHFSGTDGISICYNKGKIDYKCYSKFSSDTYDKFIDCVSLIQRAL
jgi:hypothetical protein